MFTEVVGDYARDGFVIARGAIDQTGLRRLKDDLDAFYGPDGFNVTAISLDRGGAEARAKLHEMHVASSSLAAFALLAPCIMQAAHELLPFDARPWIIRDMGYLLGLPRDERLAYDFHQESHYMPGYDDIITVHFPFLWPSTRLNGTMSVLSGSHLLGKVPARKSKRENGYTDLIPVDINDLTASFEEIHFELDLGDVAIFGGDLVHRSNFNSTDDLRPAGIFRITRDPSGSRKNLTPDEL